MTDQEINIAIAEACGRTVGDSCDYGPICKNDGGEFLGDEHLASCPCGGTGWIIPAYCSDLNAMRSAVATLPETKRGYFNAELFKVATQRPLSSAIKEPEFIFAALNASAAQRAEAFLRCLGK